MLYPTGPPGSIQAKATFHLPSGQTVVAPVAASTRMAMVAGHMIWGNRR
jgi:hypothetical protein